MKRGWTISEVEELEEAEEKAKVTQARGMSLEQFTRESWHVFDPQPLIWSYHLGVMVDHIYAWILGDIQNLIVNVPPRHGKSTLCNIVGPAWDWLYRPWRKYVCTTYSRELTLRDAMLCRLLMESDWYRSLAPQWDFDDAQHAKGFYRNTAGGWRISVAMTGGTGQGGDRLIVDDAISAGDQFSKVKREAANNRYDQAMGNRLNSVGGGRLIISQRLHEEDLPGHVVKNEPANWVRLILRTEAEADTPETPIWRDTRALGELLCPERFPTFWVAQEKRRLGSMGYAAQHQQHPVPAGGNMFKRSWVREFSIEGDWFSGYLVMGDGRRFLISECWRFIVADTAFSEKQTADPSSIGKVLVTPHSDLCFMDVLTERMQAIDVKRHLHEMNASFKPGFFAIEDRASGIEMIQEFMRQGIPIHACPTDKDKSARAWPATILMENGKMWFRAGSEWLASLVDELCTFPAGSHDDQVDMVSHAVFCLQRGAGSLRQIPVTPSPAPLKLVEQSWRRQSWMEATSA